MRATFYGFEAVKSGLTAAQAGLDVTANNIANQSTQGYSRQVVDQSATSFNSDSYKYAQSGTMTNGLGVTINGIRQIRDEFLDLRFRNANSENSAIEKTLSILSDIESNFDETQTDGLGVMIEDFYKQLQTLSLNAGEVEFSSLTRSSAQKVTQTLNHYMNQLNTVYDQEIYEMGVTVKDVNTLLNKISTINHSIQVAKLQQSSTNELNDMRNGYLDALSSHMDITVINHSDGTLSLKTGSEFLLDAQNNVVATVTLETDPGDVHLETANGNLPITGGELFGAMQVLNGMGNYAGAGQSAYRGIPYYKASLNSLATSLRDTFNTLNGAGKPLFSGTDASNIAISSGWMNDANYITATNDPSPAPGMNDNILKMVSAMDGSVAVSPYFNGGFQEFTLALMTDIAIDVNYTADISNTSDMVISSINNQRESVMGVSVNEETANLIKYQKAFEASARVMTAMDEALDVIINRMGLVGL